MISRLITITVTISLSLVIYSCQNGDELSEAESNNVKKEINQLLTDYFTISEDFVSQAIELRADVKGYTKAFNGVITDTTYSTVRKQIENMRDSGTKPILREFSDVHIFPLSTSAAACTFIVSESLIVPNQDTGVNDTISYSGNLTWVFKKINNKWKVVHESGSVQYY